MSKYVIFDNPGELDLRLLTTFGANVKEGPSPIGYFGTGLKYAIAVALRSNVRVRANIGLNQIEFFVRDEIVRGKSLPFVVYTHLVEDNLETHTDFPCGFTTELGKNWKPWMAFRELYSNTLDENGTTRTADALPDPVPGRTVFALSDSDGTFVDIWENRNEYFMGPEAKPLWVGEELEIHPGPSKGVFYKGIRVLEPLGEGIFTYNFLKGVSLNEDRTFSGGESHAQSRLGSLILRKCNDQEICRQIAEAREKSFEFGMDFNWSFYEPTQEFMTAARAVTKNSPALVNRSIVVMVLERDKGQTRPTGVLLNPIEERQLLKALDFCKRIGCEITQEVIITDSLGESILGTVFSKFPNEIYISRRAFMMGTKQVTATLLEEWVHLTEKCADGSTHMQNWLFEKICSIGEQWIGEPL